MYFNKIGETFALKSFNLIVLFLVIIISSSVFINTIPEKVIAQPSSPIAKFDWDMQKNFGNRNIDPNASFVVNLDGCSSSPGSSPIVSYSWDIVKKGDGWGPLSQTGSSCKMTPPPRLPQGSYWVALTVKSQNGDINRSSQTIIVKDYLIVTIGDSYASGEGNPNEPQRFDWTGLFIKKGPVWEDKRCHRSMNAGQSQAAQEIEDSMRTTVTYLSFACSGATIEQGLIGWYEGTEPPEDHNPVELLKPQTWQIAQALCGSVNANDPTCLDGRKIDILMISVGGNDIGFSGIIKSCIEIFGCDTSNTIKNRLNSAFSSLPGKYDRLAEDIKKRFRVSHVLITEYPDPTHNRQGHYCNNILGGIGYNEVKWAHNNVLTRLNQEVKNAAQRNGWIYVDEIAQQFGTHGYCAGKERWFRTLEDSRVIQGPFCCPQDSTGTMHPNIPGQGVYKTKLVHKIKSTFNDDWNTTPDTKITDALDGNGNKIALDGSTTTNSGVVTFQFTGTSLVGGPIAFECSIDNLPFNYCGTGSGTSKSVTYDLYSWENFMINGSHTFQVRAFDINSVIRDLSPASLTWTINAPRLPDLPRVAISAADANGNPIANGSSTSSSTITFTFDSGPEGNACVLDGTGSGCTSPQKYTNLSLGKHGIAIFDLSNSNRAAASFNWIIK